MTLPIPAEINRLLRLHRQTRNGAVLFVRPVTIVRVEEVQHSAHLDTSVKVFWLSGPQQFWHRVN